MKKHSKLALAVVTGMLLTGCVQDINKTDPVPNCDTQGTCGVTFSVNGQPKANVVVKQGAVVKHSGDVTNNQYVELPNGSYDITVTDVSGYTLSQKNFSVTVQDGRTTANIVFTKNSSGGGNNGGGNTGGGNNGGGTTPQQDVDVSLVVDGLPANQSVKVTISDQNNYPVTSVDVKGNKTVKLKPNTTYKVTGAAVSGYKTPAPKSLVVGTTKTGTRLTYATANTSTGKTNPEIKPVSGGVGKVIAQTDAARGGYYVAGKVEVHAYQAANKADWYEVYLSTTSGDFDASKRIYTNAPGVEDSKKGSLVIDTKTQLAQGQKSIVSVRYWKDGASFVKTLTILPDNLGPQVPDIKPFSKLNPGLTQQMGNWANKDIVLSFENESSLRDNPVNTDFLPAGIDYVEYFADDKVDGKVNWKTAKSLGKVFVKHPTKGYSLEFNTADKTNGLKDGKYEIFAVAVDKLGNVSAINAQNHFVLGVDNTGPTISAASFKAKDAGTGAVRDEYGNGGVQTTSPKTTVTRVKYNTRANCMIDAAGDHAGNIDLLDVVKDSGWISGLAHVENLTSPKYTDAGVGMPAGTGDSNHLWSIDGSPLNERLYIRDTVTGKLVHYNPDPSVLAPALSKPNPNNKVNDISSGNCVYLDVNGLDVSDVNIKFGYQKVPTDILGNPAVGYKDFTAKLNVDNERPENLRFTRLTDSAKADQQIQIEIAATDRVSGLRNDGPYIFGRATYGTAFGGRAVQLTSNDQVNYRIFNPGGDSNKLHILGVVFDKAGNVSSTRGEVAVTPKGPALVGPLVQGNLFVRAQLGGGNYRNFEVATDLNPIGAGVRKFDIFNEPLPGLPARNVTSFNASDVLAASLYRELNMNNALNRVGFGTADGKIDDLNLSGLQPQAPLFHIHDAESLPNSFVFNTSAAGYHAFHAAIWDKNGHVQNLRRLK